MGARGAFPSDGGEVYAERGESREIDGGSEWREVVTNADATPYGSTPPHRAFAS